MAIDLGDLTAFVAVTRGRGFRPAAGASGGSASSFSEALSRLGARLGVPLLNRKTRSVAPTEEGRPGSIFYPTFLVQDSSA
jgi:DNA-binding transcriptional LysR family regulator